MQKARAATSPLFSPRASGMAHHVGDENTSKAWAKVCTYDLIHRGMHAFPENFVGCLPVAAVAGHQSRTLASLNLSLCEDFGFVGLNLNTDTAGGYWQDPPITDRWWYPLYKKWWNLTCRR